MKNIRKILLVSACLFAIHTTALLAQNTIASEKSGLFIGAGIGGAMGYGGIATFGDNAHFEEHNSLSMLLGTRIGYQQYFNAYNGIRAYTTFDYTYFNLPSSNSKKATSLFETGINLDYLIDFTKSQSPWGAFVGIGYHWVQSKLFDEYKKEARLISGDTKVKKVSNGATINLGVSKTFNIHHHIELGARVQPSSYFIEMKDKNNSIEDRDYINIYLAYNYLF
ncbi:outer membrane beta-barrel protein [Helicobacter sp. 11S02596-1]|uniref:outer membrane beta-barrel protein n=1 Tax=Helicobacter sp. 11S02596-1 TaxID=1476194 RepID=UPI000BA670D1|nr:outer membrane beta-barrel protein [Helicobacter sp. 11S02596-1]PAF42100.1 hypothetical protein BJI48_07245 [Helicobacter sp. 11S02596-1]